MDHLSARLIEAETFLVEMMFSIRKMWVFFGFFFYFILFSSAPSEKWRRSSFWIKRLSKWTENSNFPGDFCKIPPKTPWKDLIFNLNIFTLFTLHWIQWIVFTKSTKSKSAHSEANLYSSNLLNIWSTMFMYEYTHKLTILYESKVKWNSSFTMGFVSDCIVRWI